ncbi:MAG TPA: hypothetical protein VE127_06105 [Solirubrobacteraceae bacterium]|nr:hypothetical protein [Solirubrobacteraceae bacterium]
MSIRPRTSSGPEMEIRPSRLRRGELLAGGAAVALLVFLFALGWFGSSTGTTAAASTDGWRGLPVVRWLVLVTVAAALLLAILQASRRAPALPVTMSVVVSALAVVTTLVLIVRLVTTSASVQAGAILGTAASAVILLGGFWSMRDEDGWVPETDRTIERVSL